MQIIMTIFALIDWMVYGLVSEMFSLIFLIAEVDIFKDGALDALSNRVYGVLGVIILFKIVISAIQYLISPDKLSDKDKGMGGLLTRTIISIALLALVPTIFTFAKDAQVIVSKAIPAIIIGREVGADDTKDIKEAGNWMAFTTLSTFFEKKADKTLNNDEIIQEGDFDSFLSNITAGCGFFAPSECKYTYRFIFSIPVGIFMLYILLSMGIDIAIRSIKLGILQLLAPIPIASYINNQENFKSWYTTCFKVYTDLFIRLILIYFIVFVMGIIASGNVSLGNNAFVVIYMIIAILLFAKSAPKFISDALGLKGDGMGGIADMFKPAWSRASAPLSALTNPIRNAASNAVYGYKNSNTAGKSLKNAILSGIGGFAAGTRDALSAVGQGKSAADIKQMREASKLKSQQRTNKRFQRDLALDEHNKSIEEQHGIIGKARASIAELRQKMNDMVSADPTLVTAVNQQYNQELSHKRERLKSMRKQLLKARTTEEATNLTDSINALQNEVSDMETNKSDYIRKGIIEAKYDNEMASKQTEISALQNRLRTVRYKSVEEKQRDVNRLNLLQNEFNELSANRDANIAARVDEYKGMAASVTSIETDIQTAQGKITEIEARRWDEGISFKDTVQAKINEELGLAGITGAAYTQVADILKSNRSSLWSGEAMTKLSQNPNILEVSGGQSEFIPKMIKIKNPDGTDRAFSYSVLRDLNVKIQNGTITQAEIEAQGCQSATQLQALYTEIEKSAASEYIRLASTGELKGGNDTITETLKRMRVDIVNAAISPAEKEKLLHDFDANPGKFLAAASSIQEHYRTKGSRISSYNSGKKEGS